MEKQYLGVKGLRKMISKENVYHQIEDGIIPRLIEFLKNDDFPELQEEAILVVEDFALWSSGFHKMICNTRPLPPLLINIMKRNPQNKSLLTAVFHSFTKVCSFGAKAIKKIMKEIEFLANVVMREDTLENGTLFLIGLFKEIGSCGSG